MKQPLQHSQEILPIAARRHPLIARLRQRLRSRCQCDDQSRMLVGVSGGCDSLALLIACKVICREPLQAVHVHHHLRDEADADAVHVQRVCEQLGVPVHIEHVHPGNEPGNLAAAARRLRYDALARAAAATAADVVAVAHHAEDQLETMLMAICRGSGLDGLSAMAYRSALTGSVTLIRPMLDSAKADAASLCNAAGVQWREDSSNVDRAKVRARLRADVLPVLEELWPGAAQRAAATAELVTAANEFISHKLDSTFFDESQEAWNRDELRSLPLPLLAMGIRRVAIRLLGGARDRIGQRQLQPLVQAIIDTELRPRVFELAGALQVQVTARQVTMQLMPARD